MGSGDASAPLFISWKMGTHLMKERSGSHPGALASLLADSVLELTGPHARVLVAFSGGLDSTVLTHALVRRRRRFASLRLVHVDHGLQAASAEWSKHCARQARTWRVPLISLNATIEQNRGESLEAAARDARYALIAGVLKPGEVLVTAQHRDDQVETLLLQLFRGAGVAGLSSMPRKAKFAAGLIVRPMLELARAVVEAYAKSEKLTWVEDPSNAATRFGRNYLRHRVLPLLRERWVGVDENIARSARHMAEAARLLDNVALRDLARVADGNGVNVAALRSLPAARRRNALRAFVANAGVELPSTAKMMEIAGSLLVARPDAQPEVKWHGSVMRRRGGRLELAVVAQNNPEIQLETLLKSWHWNEDREFILNGAGDSLSLIDDASGPIDLDKLPVRIEVRPRRGGEKLRPGPRARTQSLKKLLQGAHMSVETRARLPLLFDGEGPKASLIAAGDRWIDVSVSANVKSRRRARLRWIRTR
jgi:tRNA(Ile)-lysidine synthase